MNDVLAGVKRGWWSFSLPGYREHPTPGTYSLFPYQSLPALQVPAGPPWAWLRAQPARNEWSLAANGYAEGSAPDLGRLPGLMAQAGVALSASFVAFMQSPALHARLRSCTACLLEPSDYVVRTTNPPDGVILRFLSDQQGVLGWYLFADRSGNEAVLVSAEPWGMAYDADEERREQVDLLRERIWLCAPSFEEYIYRFWLENEIWFGVLNDKQPPTPLQRLYLEHYLLSTT